MKSSFSPSQATLLLLILFTYLIGLFFAGGSTETPLTSGSAPSTSESPFLPETPLDLNTADFYDLQLLPFIGPGYATRILEYRERQGGFKNIHELKNIPGINEYKFEKLRVYLVAP
ncbi:MAG TPA: helix-hairpin-helix domain-containing protein [Candidatus Limnocylindrales bacterium]|nr:helix-hairpin-helix domain-containing protein [Candidatus Limnocylindrales bacterium]